ncbi:MAG TPA: DivIVA domain-containing protein [Actinomycetota bacterium]|nr:DivIVA domain-containing protein [Actinomycetota bacterium]
MTITPHDIQHKQFREAFRGYNEEDVDTFLDEVAEEYGRVYAENQRLRIQLASVQQEAAYRGATGSTETPAAAPAGTASASPAVRAEERAEAREEMKRALVATQRAAEAALEEAKRRAAEIVARAEQRAKEIDEMTARRAKDVDSGAAGALTTIQARVEELRRQEIELRQRLRRMLAEHVRMLQQLEGEAVGATALTSAPSSAAVNGPADTPSPAAHMPVAGDAAAASSSPDASVKRPTRWDSPRAKPVPDGPRPAGIGLRRAAGAEPPAPPPRPMGVRPEGPATSTPSVAEPDTRAAVVARMTRELGDAANPPTEPAPADAREFWRR